MAGYTYTTYKLAIQTGIASQDPDPDFATIFPSCIDYAEQRIYRELNLISTVTTDTTTVTASGQRNLSIPNNFVVINNISVLTPAGTDATSGSRSPLVPVSRDMLDFFWPSNTTIDTPEMFAMVDQWSMVLGPAPDGVYTVEVVGTQRPAPLSATNTTTFLSERLPDLFYAAGMVFMSLYMRNFTAAGAGSGSDPQMSGGWEAQYQMLKSSADVEEARKYFNAASWSSWPLSSQAQPQRG